MRTSTRISFGLYDVTAKGDAQPSSNDIEPFCDPYDLVVETPELVKYGTLEEKQFLLDGSFTMFPDEPNGLFWGYWSQQLSDAAGAFTVPPQVTVLFTQPHSSIGVTFHFYAPTNDWASEIYVIWKGLAGETLASGVYYPDGVNFFISKKVENYYSVVIQFNRTSLPYRRVKMVAVDFGATMVFEGTDIINAQVLEEIDVLSSEVRVNTLDFSLYSKDSEFSLLNPKGIFSVLQTKQALIVEEIVEANTIPIGTFYLSEWSNTSNTISNFKAVDLIGGLDSAPFMGGLYNTTASALCAEILNGYDYKLDDVLADIAIAGYLPVGTRRTALQQLAFAIGAVVDCSRGNTINVYNPPVRPSTYITYRRKFEGGKVTMRPLITGVKVSAFAYTPDAEERQLLQETLPAGNHTVTFTEPIHSLTATGATITHWGDNYAVILVSIRGPVTLTGKPYIKTTTTVTATASNIPANAEENILLVEGATLVSPGLAPLVAQNIIEYYANRYEQSFRMIAGQEVLADMVILETFGKEKLRGRFESMSLDLTGGFLVSAKVVGTRIDTTENAFTGEFYAGERGLI